MKNYAFYILVALILSFTACSREEFLDFPPKGVVIPSTVKDYRLLLDQVDIAPWIFDALSVGFDEKHTLNQFLSDDQELTDDIVNLGGVFGESRRVFLFEDVIFSALDNDFSWDIYYNTIYASNVALEGLSTVTDGTPEEIALLQSEARMHRAYVYFNLVNLYGVHYDPATAATDLGVPFREGIALEGVDLTRKSVQEVYDFVLQEINESIPQLPDVQPAELIFRPSKAGAYGLLAKIYLYQGKYQMAFEAVNSALNLKGALRDMNNDGFTSFFPFIRALPSARDNIENVWQKGISFTNDYPSNEIVGLYDDDDIRLQWFATRQLAFSEDVDAFVFLANGDNHQGSQSDGILTSDLHLIRAECHARLGNIAEANTDLNALRESRYITGTYTPLNITDPTALLNSIKEERRKEMGMGMERSFDIKRYNKFDNANISLTHTLGGVTATLEPNSPNWALPIGNIYIQQNPEIIQNPRE